MPIPEELLAYPQWVLWKYAATPKGRQTKLPYSAVTGQLASVNDPSTWATYDKAVAALAFGQHSGIGFVLSEADPYTFIDLDDPKGDAAVIDTQVKIAGAFDTYSEVSPSGQGLHLILKGKIPEGRRRNYIEVYSSLRYMTVTGLTHHNKPIAERQQLLETLWAELGGTTSRVDAAASQDQPERYTDEEIYKQARNAENGDKFDRLFQGDWQSYYPSQSEADFALINIISFYSRNIEQIRRLFLTSALGQRDKANKRKSYVDEMIRKSFDNVHPVVRSDSLIESVKETIAAKAKPFASPLFQNVRAWPAPLGAEAFQGLAGEFVRLVGPETESDYASLLFSFLVAMGSIIGRGPYYRVGGDRHYTNLFTVIVGKTSKARKGMSWGEVRRFAELVEEQWCKKRVAGGLSSGEGLIHAVRDPIIEMAPLREGKRVVGHEAQMTDAGVDDKRLLAVESEMSQALQSAGRDGNTLSAIIRLAWDGGPLRVLAKNAKAACLEPHISILAHITVTELQRQLTSTDMANGFANRFLWVCASRSKSLPFGGAVNDGALRELAARVRQAIDFARNVGRLEFVSDARTEWERVYRNLSEGRLGLLEAITARAEAQAVRLAMLYALLDESADIKLVHLRAALAAWRYCEDSARFIFGDSIGDPTADEILALLRGSGEGVTRNALMDHFKRNKSSAEIGRALAVLQSHGLACVERHERDGRTAEVWKAVVVQSNNQE
jgi:hypothetical protein